MLFSLREMNSIPVRVSGKKLTCRLLYETLNEHMASFEYQSINENKQTSPTQFIDGSATLTLHGAIVGLISNLEF